MTYPLKTRIAALALGAALIPALALAHGKDDKTHQKQTLDFENFEEISVSGVYDLDVTVGEAFSIKLSGHEREMDNLKVYEKNGTLHLGKKNKRQKFKNSNGIEANITLPNLTGFRISGVAEGHITGIEADNFDIRVSGVGEVTLSGSCDHMTARVSGVGEIDAEDLECKDVHVAMSGVGEANIYASNSVDVSASGVGEVNVWGQPDEVSKSKGWMSSVNIK